jgi:hypothetical protein
VNLSCFFRVVSCVSGVARGRMGVMGRLLVMASFVVLGSFTVMAGRVGMMLCSLLVMLRRFFGRGVSLGWPGRPCVKRRDRGEFRYAAETIALAEGGPFLTPGVVLNLSVKKDGE